MDALGLRSERARAVFDYIQCSPDHPFARIESVRTEETHDVLDIVVEPQVPQDRAVEILPEEPVRVHFPLDDGKPPTIHSRRDDFPLNHVHTNYAPDIDGICLCIWEENWNDLRRVLSGQALVERIRDWFSRTAAGVLHQDGQALEPLLPASAHTLIIPPGPPAEVWVIPYADHHQGRWTVVAEPPSPERSAAQNLSFTVLQVPFAPVVHGALRVHPSNINELCTLASGLGTDLTVKLREWLLDSERLRAAHERKLLLILTVPKLRDESRDVESWEILAFMPTATLAELGEALGCTVFDRGTRTTVARVPAGQPCDLVKIRLDYWNVMRRLDRAMARVYAANAARQDRNLVAIGAGAIGSNVVVNAARTGIGTWTIIDNDVVLPHNTVRQFQRNPTIGAPKSVALAFDANAVLAEDGTARFIRADILNPGEYAEEIRESFKGADLVLDFSASPAVLGHVSDRSELRRAASFFFNPNGSDLVVLAEDDRRALRLDEIEAQYFLAAAADCRLAQHLNGARLDLLRYANACQDLTRPVPPWQVHTLSGVATSRLLGLLEQPGALARLWRLDITTGAITPVAIDLASAFRHSIGDWRFTVSHAALQSMRRLRADALPNESGGILIGSFDLSRRVAHVVAALPAPPDSVQMPTYFIRGSKDLRPVVDRLAVTSAGVIRYLGEWHSHPDRSRAAPSSDDEAVDAYLAKHLGPTGEPHLIAICGTEETWFRLGCAGQQRGEAVIRDDDS